MIGLQSCRLDMSSTPPPATFELASKNKSPPPSDTPPTSNSPPPDLSPPPPTAEPSPPPPPPDISSSPPPPDQSSPPPPKSDQSPPPPKSDQSPPPPKSDQSPPPTPAPSSPPPPSPPDSPPPPNVLTPPPPPDSSPPPPPPDSSPPPPLPDSSPPPPHHKHSPPPATPPTSPASPPPPPPDNAASPPPPTDQSRPPPLPSSPPPPQSTSPPPVNTPPPPSKLAPTPPDNAPRPSPESPPSNSSRRETPAVSPLPSVSTKKSVTEREASAQNQGAGAQTVVVGGLVGLFALSLLVVAVWFVSKRRKRQRGLDIYRLPSQYSSSHNSESSFLKPPRPLHESQSGSESMFADESGSGNGGGLGSSRQWFTYQELSDATDRFSSQNVLGEGGFGCVYKGRLVDGTVVAVKQLKVGSGQGEREFRAEVDIISRIHHRHLVSLVGYCISDRQRLLVYEYISNDTLENHLHAEGRPVLDWAHRVKIAIGSARGLAYLHEDCHPRIIHRDIKSANILLDENFESRVADFGLARLASDTHTHVSTRVMGTFGYMAPEYASSGKLTEKSDVYSFGVVLLELITGRKPVDLSQDESLVEWARPLLVQALETENFKELADPRLENDYLDAEMFRMIEAAGACVRHSAAKRPKMGQVVRAFDSMGELTDLTNGMKPGQSGIFNTAEQSAQMRMFQRMAFGSQEYSNGFFNETQSSWSSDSGSRASRGPRL